MPLYDNIGQFPPPSLKLADSSYEVVEQYEIFSNNTLYVPFPCQETYDCSPYKVLFKAGSYKVELYGAEGGRAYSNRKSRWYDGGKGGCVNALLSFPRTTEAFLFIGGRGIDKNTGKEKGGYNGGGDSIMNRGSGGGATDIRLKMNDYYSRLIVAAGGGAAFTNDAPDGGQINGGNGGGLDGEVVGELTTRGDYPCFGSQTNCIVPAGYRTTNNYDDGTFGEGSNKKYGGGGGGWWGGGSANGYGGAGGSSYYGNLPYRETKTGINNGNGFALITTIVLFKPHTCKHNTNLQVYLIVFISINILLK